MRKNRASATAKMVALWRALAHVGHTSVRNFSDPYAAEMLSGKWKVAYELLRRRLERMTEAQRQQVSDRFDPVPMRVAVIDQELLAAVERGVRQVVILGAGFDTRAHRFDALKGVKLFEVDHPLTQGEKRARTSLLPRAKADVVYTAVDFERESLAEQLSLAGHDKHRPTVWIWEGVVMYLADDAVSRTLDVIKACSAAGSVLVLHYHEPSAGVAQSGLRDLGLRWLGEPQIGLRSRAEMERLVVRAGLTVRDDLGHREQAARTGGREVDHDLARVSRILLATAG